MRLRPPGVFIPLLLLAVACTAGRAADEARPKESGPVPTPTASPTLVIPPGGVGPELFGMHDSDPVGGSWPDAPVGSLRVWDSGTVWSQVETSPGVYDFSRLDAIVETAREQDAEVLIVLGQTPAFHALRPKKVGAYGAGASAMPRVEAWTAYVRAVTTRYQAPDVAFQVWNEANVEGYWSGTPRQMAKLTAAARAVVDELTPVPTLVAPAMATRTLGQRGWLRLFYARRVGGVPVGDLVDVVSLQLYPAAGEPPEVAATLLTEARRIIGLQGVSEDKPIWNTEINYGLQGGVPATPAPEDVQRGNVARTYLLNAAEGVDRVYWYSWDLHTIADTELVQADNEALTPAGEAYERMRTWLLGTVPGTCDAGPNGTYVCTFEAADEIRRVYWNPDRDAQVRTAFDASSVERLDKSPVALQVGGTTLTVSEVPVLVTSRRSGDIKPGPLDQISVQADG